MSNPIYIGNITQGLTTNRTPFNIDNDAFPSLMNFYSWRGRLKRKRGTEELARLQLQFVLGTSIGTVNTIVGVSTYNVFSNTNAIGGTEKISVLQPGASIVPGTGAKPLVFVLGAQTLTDTGGTGTFVVTGAGVISSATINYATGVLSITGTGVAALVSTVTSGSYYPSLPVMGLENYNPIINPMEKTVLTDYPLLLAFDTQYSYQNFHKSSLQDYSFYNVNYYKNPPTGTYAGYTAKSTQTPFQWSGEDYQQFWTTNFQEALWATNGKPGFHIVAIDGTITRLSGQSVTFDVTDNVGIIGDFIFVNEIVDSGTPSMADTINQQTGYITNVAGTTITVVFPNANISAPTTAYIGGIIQYLTNTVGTIGGYSGGDGIRWYDGDPTMATGLSSVSPSGWVNFSPPLSEGGITISGYSSGSTPYYLVGANIIAPYQDRLLCFGVYITNSSNWLAGKKAEYLPYIILWSSNVTVLYGSSFYTSSFDSSATPIVYTPILTPQSGDTNFTSSEGSSVLAWNVETISYGSYLSVGANQSIVTIGPNEDVILLGLLSRQARLVATGNGLTPFLVYNINSELGTSATYSGIVFDRGLLSFGTYGFALATQQSAQRIDLQIPDSAFQITSSNFGVQRINSVRNFYREWCYFTYQPEGQESTSLFPTQTLMYNYRDNTWATLKENYTTQGTFWIYADFGGAEGLSAFSPNVIAGTPQGFVVFKDSDSADEAPQAYISGIASELVGIVVLTKITSYNHCLDVNDYIYITNCLGPTSYNNQVGKILYVVDKDNFVVDITYNATAYIGKGVFAKLVVPFMQSKQFPSFFEVGRQTRIGVQQYMMESTSSGQVTLNLYLSMDALNPYNSMYVVPSVLSPNDSLIYSNILYTSPELATWNCSGLSLGNVGNGVSLTYAFNYKTLFNFTASIVAGSIYVKVGNVATFTDNGTGGFTVTGTGNAGTSTVNYNTGEVTLGFSSAPTSQYSVTNFQYLQGNIQDPTASAQSQIWHRMNTSLIGDTVQFGITLSDDQMKNKTIATSEIILHGAIINTYTGPLLS